jgi:hypothetical protein
LNGVRQKYSGAEQGNKHDQQLDHGTLPLHRSVTGVLVKAWRFRVVSSKNGFIAAAWNSLAPNGDPTREKNDSRLKKNVGAKALF